MLLQCLINYPRTYISHGVLCVSKRSSMSNPSSGTIPPTFHVLTRTLKHIIKFHVKKTLYVQLYSYNTILNVVDSRSTRNQDSSVALIPMPFKIKGLVVNCHPNFTNYIPVKIFILIKQSSNNIYIYLYIYIEAFEYISKHMLSS